MNEIMILFFSMSVSGSLLILILLLGRPLYQNRFSKSWQYYIWLVVIARLLLPFTTEVGPVGALFGQAEERLFKKIATADLEREEKGNSPLAFVLGDYSDLTMDSGAGSLGGAGTDRGTQAGEELEDGGIWKRIGILAAEIRAGFWLIWLGGAFLLFVRKVTAYQSFVTYIKAGRKEVSDIELLERLSQAGEELRVKGGVELCTSGLVPSPLLFGFFHPCIVLPDADLSKTDFGYIIRHELIHYKRGDMFYKWLVQAALCLHWFNPLVYRMEREIRRACELACDEAVVGMLDQRQRRGYGDTLLHAMEMGGGFKDSPGALTLNEGAALLKERLGAIMGFKKISKRMRGCSLLLALLFAAGAVGMGAYAAPAGAGEISPASTGDVLAVVKGEPDAVFRYTQKGYYEASYLFEVGWNVNENAEGIYPSRELDFGDESGMEVFYTDECIGIWEDEVAVNALAALLARLKSDSAGTDFPLIRPLVVSVQNFGNVEPLALARQYYEDGNISGYAAVFALLAREQQNVLLQRTYEDSGITFFSAALSQLEEDGRLIESFAQQAYEDDRISFFSVLADYMDRKTLKDWLSKATADEKRNFQVMLFDRLGMDAEKETMEQELDERRMEEYGGYGITREGAAYFYQGEVVRILMDTRQDGSFLFLEQNPKGTVDIRIIRDQKGIIENVRYLTEAERKELFGDGEKSGEEESNEEETNRGEADGKELDEEEPGGKIKEGDMAESAGVSRLKTENLPKSVKEAISGCEGETWYVIYDGGQQYIFYDGFAWEYAYEPVRLTQGWRLRIELLRKKDGGCLLLRLGDEAPVTITCDGEEVVPKIVGAPLEAPIIE